MTYSALIGGVGVDTSKKETREAVFKDVRAIFSHVERGNNFYPENHHYVVSTIDRGKYCMQATAIIMLLANNGSTLLFF